MRGDIKRILVIELWNIGDIVLTMPFLAQLRVRFPHARISMLARPIARDLLEGTGLVDQVIDADLTWGQFGGLQLSKRTVGFWLAVKRVRAGKFDLVFSARPHRRERLLLVLSGAARTLGHRVIEPRADGHRVEDWLRLLEPFGVSSATAPPPRLVISAEERTSARSYLLAQGVWREDLVIGIHPGASLAQKRWPLSGFREVALALVGQSGMRVLAFAEPSGYGSELFAIPRIVPAKVSLREMMALIAQCHLFVCNDSGPMHIAGALGVPTVAMFGAGIHRWFAPLGGNHQILQPSAIAVEGGVRTPHGITASEVIEVVGKAARRIRQDAVLSRG
jgi:ADP-heptose:LPS heptosyltransferase